MTPNELALVTALAAQLAVAVQNARLHEQVKRQEAARRAALEAEQSASRTVQIANIGGLTLSGTVAASGNFRVKMTNPSFFRLKLKRTT